MWLHQFTAAENPDYDLLASTSFPRPTYPAQLQCLDYRSTFLSSQQASEKHPAEKAKLEDTNNVLLNILLASVCLNVRSSTPWQLRCGHGLICGLLGGGKSSKKHLETLQIYGKMFHNITKLKHADYVFTH